MEAYLGYHLIRSLQHSCKYFYLPISKHVLDFPPTTTNAKKDMRHQLTAERRLLANCKERGKFFFSLPQAIWESVSRRPAGLDPGVMVGRRGAEIKPAARALSWPLGSRPTPLMPHGRVAQRGGLWCHLRHRLRTLRTRPSPTSAAMMSSDLTADGRID